MKFALAGIGKWGQVYLKTIQQVIGAELVATCSRNNSELPTELQIAPHFLSLEEMISNVEFDTLIIATPAITHYDMSVLGLLNNKHVICEKPARFTDKELNNIINLSRENIFYVDYTNVYHKIVTDMIVDTHCCSNLPLIKLVNCGNGPIRNDCSDLFDYGSHVLSVVYTVFPKTEFSIKSYSLDNQGNHCLVLNSNEGMVESVFGNRASHRIHTFEFVSNHHTKFWSNDKSENPLKVMLEKFSNREISSNIYLSRQVNDMLSKVENLNKALNIRS